MAQQSKWGSIIAVLTILLICVATLTPGTPPSPDDAARICVGGCDDALLADFLRNIVLFMPLGFALRLAGMRVSRAILIGSCLSGLVELLQIRVVVGRDASFLDWISNSAGTAMGVLIATNLNILLRPAPQTARRLAACALAACILTLTLGGWGVQPAPSTSPFYGERTPMLGNSVFAGALLSARVNGEELPSELMRHADSTRKLLLAGRVSMDAVVRAAPMPDAKDLVAISRVADGDQHEILLLGRDRRQLVFRLRMHATAARLETPAFALADVFPSGSADDRESVAAPPETVTAVLQSGRIRLSASTGDGLRQLNFALTPALGWTFFLPWDYWLGPNAVVFSTAWLVLLVLPIAYWGAQSAVDRKSRRVLVSMAVTLVSSVVLVPLLFGLPTPDVGSFLALLIGASVGGIAGVAARPRSLTERAQ